MAISVIGLGKLGLCTAACLAAKGYAVWGMDVNSEYIAQLIEGDLPFFETNLDSILEKARENIVFTDDISEAVENSNASFIIVPTPSKPCGSFDNTYIIKVLKRMIPTLKTKDDFHIVNIVSTVMPGSAEREFIPLLEQETGKRAGVEFGFAYNPEFIAIGSVIENFLNPDLVLIGESDTKTGEFIENIYRGTCENTPHFGRTSIINAEIAKLVINCYCTLKISFANYLATVCENVGHADANEITDIIGRDSRIGGKYIKPGLGFGGPCFPRDNIAFIQFAKKIGVGAGLMQNVVDINNAQVERVAKKIVDASEKSGSRIAVLGLTYKPNTYLTECSQALEVTLFLLQNHPELIVRAYDPLALTNGKIKTTSSLRDCVRGANVAAILTPWPEFYQQDWKELMAENSSVLDFWS
jgi:UDPglucose 6-dehydrogenase